MVNAPVISDGYAYTTPVRKQTTPELEDFTYTTSTIPPDECQEIIQVPTVFEGIKVFPSHFGQCYDAPRNLLQSLGGCFMSLC